MCLMCGSCEQHGSTASGSWGTASSSASSLKRRAGKQLNFFRKLWASKNICDCHCCVQFLGVFSDLYFFFVKVCFCPKFGETDCFACH